MSNTLIVIDNLEIQSLRAWLSQYRAFLSLYTKFRSFSNLFTPLLLKSCCQGLCMCILQAASCFMKMNNSPFQLSTQKIIFYFHLIEWQSFIATTANNALTVAIFAIGAKVSIQSTPYFCLQPRITNLSLCRSTVPSWLYIVLNRHLPNGSEIISHDHSHFSSRVASASFFAPSVEHEAQLH